MLAKVEMQPLATVEDAKNYMLASFRQFQSIVGSVEKCKRYFAIGLHCLEQVPKILECPRASFRNALVEAARLDLEPNSVQQFCWIIPRAKEKGGRPIARLEVGYRGLVQLVLRDGGVKSIWAMAVDEADEFRRQEGSERVLIHNLANQFHDGSVATMVAAYACAKLHNDEVMHVVMDRAELEAARKLSHSSAYDGPFALEMYKKTPLKRLCKLLPLKTPVLATIAHLEDELDGEVPEPAESRVQALEPVITEIQTEQDPPEKTELPTETRQELNSRILRTWDRLVELGAAPQLQQPPEYYASIHQDEGTAREFADFLAREMLKAERAR